MVRVIALRAHSGSCWGVGREGSLAALAEVQVRGYQREGIGAGLRGAAEPGTPCGLGSLGARRPLISVGVGRRGWSRGRSWALAKKEILWQRKRFTLACSSAELGPLGPLVMEP